MFNALPWVDSKYHIVDGVSKIATMDSNGVFTFDVAVRPRELIALGKWLEVANLPINDNKEPKQVPETVDKPKKAKAIKATPKPSKSKWAGVLDGKEHTLTLKQTGYKDFAGFRSMMSTFAKKQGYGFTSSVDGNKITFTCVKK